MKKARITELNWKSPIMLKKGRYIAAVFATFQFEDGTIKKDIDIYKDVLKVNGWKKLSKRRFNMLKEKLSKMIIVVDETNWKIQNMDVVLRTDISPGQRFFFESDEQMYFKAKNVRLVYEEAILDNEKIVVKSPKLWILYEDQNGKRRVVEIIQRVRALNGMKKVSKKLKKEIEQKINNEGVYLDSNGNIKMLNSLIKVR